MKCYNHTNVEAVATCLGCGKAMCMECCSKNESKIVCSRACAEKIDGQNDVINLIRHKTLTQNKVSGIFSIIGGAIFGLFGIFHITKGNYFLPLSIFAIALGLGLFIAGIMYLKVAKTKK